MSIHVTPRDLGWAVIRSGAERATAVYDTQATAIAHGRAIAKQEKAELVIHGVNGRIRDKESFGNDPFPPRDRR